MAPIVESDQHVYFHEWREWGCHSWMCNQHELSSVGVPNSRQCVRLSGTGGMVGSTRKTRAKKQSSRHVAREEENSLELSQLDLQVLERLRQGKTYKAIAHELNMSESTVELHIRHSLERIDARNRAELLSRIRRPQ